MPQAGQKISFEIGLFMNEISKITTTWQTRVLKNTKKNFEAHTYGRKLVFVAKYLIWGWGI